MFKRLGLFLPVQMPLPDAIRVVQYAELRGFEAIWQAERVLLRDSLVVLAALGAVTTRIKLGASVLDPWTRNAGLIATSLVTLDELAPDRILCGLGGWTDGEAARVGIARDRPLLALREVTNALSELIAGRIVSRSGEFVTLLNAQIPEHEMRLQSRRIPIYLGGTAPRTLALAGELADGALLNYLVTPAYTRAALNEIRRGAAVTHRPIEFIDRPQLIACSVNRNRAQAMAEAQRFVAGAVLAQPALMQANGVAASLIDVIVRTASETGLDAAAHLVPEEVLLALMAVGTPDDVRRKVNDYLDAGATSPVLYCIGDDIRFMIDVFTDPYLS
ncbi:MAG: 5,10-methylenetetrahydromethanopterin reductase [Chloroflexota bacterium]|nr:MAG: 5,10-methylenetetrahydromethanopterin reductase [Chloroflexota bacterium]